MSENEPGKDEPYGVLALMDEFGNMAKINKLKDGMSFLRSYHVRAVIIVQYLGQIISVYGRDDAKGFLNSKVKIAFALNDIDDAQFFSKSLGNKTIRVSSHSSSASYAFCLCGSDGQFSNGSPRLAARVCRLAPSL